MSSTETTNKNLFDIVVEKARTIVNSFGEIQTAWGLIVAVVLAVAFLYAIFSFRKRVNKRTSSQIQFFVKVKKYEPELYIELNRNMECLRYFVFSHNWKTRIVQAYNKLFAGYEGKRLKKAFKDDCVYRVSYFTKMSVIAQRLESLNRLFESIRSEKEVYRENLGEYFYIVRNLAYDYSKSINLLLENCDMITHKAVLLVGSAGNGKTNLLCKLSEVAIKSKIPVMLINSRDIDDNCTDYILNNLPLLKKLKGFSVIYLHLISFLLLVQRKHFYIFIDAINENDREVFVNSIGKTIDYFSKFPRIRILLTCRSEYFQSRYKNYFDKCEHAPYLFDMMATHYDERALNKMFIAYQNHFNVKSEISLHAKKRLLSSLFLMKIFFEVNCNRNENIIELRNAEIYLSYIRKIAANIKEIDFLQTIYKIAGAMIEDCQYNYVNLNRVGIDGADREKLYQVLDNNLIISRTLLSGKGITESENEVVIFVFDEFRDFCLARYLLLYSEDKQDNEYLLFFDKVNEMFQNRQSPVEGIIKYGYYYFKTYGPPELSEKILTLYSETDIQYIANRENRYNPPYRLFDNFGLSLIFIDGGEITENELNFLKKYIARDPSNYWPIFWFLLKNEYSSVSPRIDLGIRLLVKDRSSDEVFKTIDSFFDDRNDYRYYGGDDKRWVSILSDRLEHIQEQNGSLSLELKQFIVLLCSYDPHEPRLRQYRRFVLEQSVYAALLELLQGTELMDSIQELKSAVEERKIPRDVLSELLSSFMQGGGFSDN